MNDLLEILDKSPVPWILIVIVAFIGMALGAWVWIALGILAAMAALAWGIKEYDERRAAALNRARAEQAALAEAAQNERARKRVKAKQLRIKTVGKENAALIDSALAAVRHVGASEAARAGWLGDVDFTADIQEISDKFEKAHALRKVASELSALDKPSSDDRRILAEAKTTAANLELAAVQRVELIGKCATEARLIDKSLHNEREDARTAEQRAELHGKLSAMLYGIEATPDTGPADSAADAVMARVRAYREIKNQIQIARDSYGPDVATLGCPLPATVLPASRSSEPGPTAVEPKEVSHINASSDGGCPHPRSRYRSAHRHRRIDLAAHGRG